MVRSVEHAGIIFKGIGIPTYVLGCTGFKLNAGKSCSGLGPPPR
jgi:hypothetical protein